jgi:prevent-host-death family protein
MVRRYSVTEARNNFARIVHEVESGDTVEVTRRGKPVAVLMAKEEHERLTRGSRQLSGPSL